jgi:hypothetical protein
MATSEDSPEKPSEQTELFPMSSAADFPVRTFRSPEKALEWLESAAAYGPSIPVLLASYDPATSSWKTSQHCLVEGLQTFSETWPRSGMMRSGTAYQLPPLVPLTDATASGYWPTPNATSNDKTPCKTDADLAWSNKPRPNGAKVQARLQDAAAFWPTPRANDAEKRGNINPDDPRNGLPAAVLRFPTPTRSMHKGSSAGAMTRSSGASRLNDRLDYAVEQGNIRTGRLNPLWVAWLMGFPIEWASFEPTETP